MFVVRSNTNLPSRLQHFVLPDAEGYGSMGKLDGIFDLLEAARKPPPNLKKLQNTLEELDKQWELQRSDISQAIDLARVKLGCPVPGS
jgi:hypothetical protein